MSEKYAEELLKNVNVRASELALNETTSERGYVKLGWLMLEVSEMGYWQVRYETFTEYLKTVAQISHKSVPQLRQYFLAVRDLSGTFSAEQLEEMGISKALKLRQAKDYAKIIPQNIVDAALDSTVTVKDLRKLIATELKMPEEKGDYMNLEMEFMVSPEQRALIEQAVEVAKHTEPLTKPTIAKSQQMLDIMLKFCQEFLGAHSGDGN